MNSHSLSPKSIALLRDVAAALIESGECVYPYRHTNHVCRRKREKQMIHAVIDLTKANGTAPTRTQIAAYCGVSKARVTQVLGAQRKYKRQRAEIAPD